MRNLKSQLDVLPKPRILGELALLFVILAIVTTPEMLISLGPMRTSLTSHIQSVRDIAYVEVTVLRVLASALAATLVVTAMTRRRILDSSLVRHINVHAPKESPGHSAVMRFFNRSLLISGAFVVAGLLHVGLIASLLSPTQLFAVSGEDGVIEYSTAIIFLMCSLVSARLSFKFAGQRARVVIHALFAFVFFLMVGEEISWGQRIFNIGLPEALRNANVQGEINLHNMYGYFADHIFIMGVFVFGCLMPLLARFSVFYRKLFDLLGLPIASPGLAIGFLIISMLQRSLVHVFLAPPPGAELEELREFLTAVAFGLLMYESWLLSRPSENTDSVKVPKACADAENEVTNMKTDRERSEGPVHGL